MSPSSYFAPRKALVVLLGLTMGLAVAALGPLPACADTCARTAATAAGCTLDNEACLCAHPGFAKGADSCAQNVCRDSADRKAASDAFAALVASCGNGSTTVTVTNTQTGSTSGSASATGSTSGGSSHSGSSTKSSTKSTTGSSTKPSSTITTTSATPTTITGSVTPSTTATASSITTTLNTPSVPLLTPTTPSGTAVIMQTVVVPDASATPISAARPMHVLSLWSLGALFIGVAGATLF